MREIVIGQTAVSEASAPYLIAEIGVNHGGELELAKRMVREAKEAGADAVKFQYYKAAKLAAAASPAYWKEEKTQREFFKQYDRLDAEDYLELANCCARVGIDFLCTAFDEAAIDAVDPYVPAHKVASADLTNTPLLRHLAAKGKPVLLSTGAAELGEIRAALAVLAAAGSPQVALLHCVLSYPTAPQDAQLATIAFLRCAFPDHLIGYSDHTLPDERMLTATIAAALGARVIEKHFTFDKTLPGNDHYHAMDGADLRLLKSNLAHTLKVVGSEVKAVAESEKAARLYARRSIVSARQISKGEPLSAENLTCKRPGTGISPVHWDEVLGAIAAENIPEDTILAPSMIQRAPHP